MTGHTRTIINGHHVTGYGNDSLYQLRGSYPTGGSSSSGPSLRALKWIILLPLLLIRWAMRSGDK